VKELGAEIYSTENEEKSLVVALEPNDERKNVQVFHGKQYQQIY